MPRYQLAQLNIANLLAPLDSPQLVDFVDNLDRINALAEASPGFCWRLQTEDGDATALRPFGDELLVNISVWQDLDSLRNFVFKTAHSDILKRRREWFDRMSTAYTVLWWVKQGHQPSVEEAKIKLDLLREIGPSPQAFSFKQAFDAISLG